MKTKTREKLFNFSMIFIWAYIVFWGISGHLHAANNPELTRTQIVQWTFRKALFMDYWP